MAMQSNPGQANPGQANPGQANPGQANPGQANPGGAVRTSGSAESVAEQRQRTRRIAIAGGVGTLIEYYDFSVYGYLAIIVAPLFFPNKSPVVSLLSALAVFGTAYLIRPIGGIVFGYIGDTYGRKTALIGTLMCMGIASTLMGVLPTYAMAGVWATVLLVLVRLAQGFSAGGEVGGAATFISEAAPAGEKARWGSFTPLGSTGGFALAAAVAGAVTGLTTDAQLETWGWRVPFLLALPLTLVCLWIRSRTEETLAGAGHTKTKKQHAPVTGVLVRQPAQVLKATLISLAANGTAYIGLTYLSIHLVQRLGYPRPPVYWIATAVIGLSALLMPLGGRLGDRIGPIGLGVVGLVGYIVVTYPMLGLMDRGLAVAAIAYLVIMINTVTTQVSAYTLIPQLFQPQFRFTGVALGWNLGVIIAGGTAPFLGVWLIEETGNTLAPAFFVIVVAALGLVGTLASRKEVTAYRANPI